ncbi:hypothetical protein K435DRAFT_871830 [Dendrothele bispora CBS 962.96]|uniref:Uncharacterized protein n=1 Tax=Dendrothele bispora (strain CBS 962.96) TaxID=1314807 RepID=A0A4S8L389_DENBC|nr:hypothetical protein K435DRAFT_871830 [Dendrothele bispora CBS 962.96]
MLDDTKDADSDQLWSQGGQESHGDESSDDENKPVIEESDESDAMDIDLDSKNQRLRGKALDTTPLPFDRVDVWHQFKLNPTSLVDGEVWVETVKALPVWKHSTNTRFDTVIALVNDNAESTADGRVGRVRVIFQLPSELRKHGSRTSFVVPWKQEPLVYVEWYSNFRKSPDGPHGMYLVTKTKDSDGHPQGKVVEMARIRQVCMLMPADPKLNHTCHIQHGPSQDNTLPSLYFHDAQGKEQSASPPQHQPDSDPPGEPLPFDVSAQAEFQVNDERQTSLADILQGVCELKECVLQQAEKDRAQRSEEHDHIVTCLQQQTEALKRLTDLLESQATS